ncbi:glycogen/starch synthase [Lutimonas zeaxanthinifaciens]|uniref:glycogen/starch synthase n=1 Tax=Lutimonas zeaxanthinifaciens TaxID=3060215 RepID=UPI00265CBE10|nr:glycogen/starch synthase [Lutimonas sp. YSD2104]WKK66241.1 glycogen/starch synthase [Lutimonas sp. YSD2104]
MKDKRILYISSELTPYLPETEVSKMAFEVPKEMHSQGAQIRMFMPRFGVINERRHQLHEVIRLSGMNLIINDMDMPLIIKVASLPKERMQVYFIDNEEYFRRKAVFTDEEGKLFPDNDERAIFFAKGVVETVKKLNWSPDIIHIHGWMASLLPLYLREYYKNDPLFADSKIVTSAFNYQNSGVLSGDKLIDKIKFDQIAEEKLESFTKGNGNSFVKVAIENSDAVIKGSEELSDEISEVIENLEIPVLDYQPIEEFSDAYSDFYLNKVL